MGIRPEEQYDKKSVPGSSGIGKSEPNAASVRTILCHKHMETGLKCLGSFQKRSCEKYKIIIHDDGTLLLEDKSKLQDNLDCSVLDRKSADEIAEAKLRDFPLTRMFRSRNVFALKLLDCCWNDSVMRYIDSDIYFRRSFSGLFKDQKGAITTEPLWDASESVKGLTTFAGVQGGIIFAPAVGLSEIESILESNHVKKTRLEEQNIWSILAPKMGMNVFDQPEPFSASSRQIHTCSTLKAIQRAIRKNAVALHLICGGKSKLDSILMRTDSEDLHCIKTYPGIKSGRLAHLFASNPIRHRWKVKLCKLLFEMT